MRNRKAFTLVEMLVVIVILGILAALVSGVAIGAMRAARQGAILTEMSQIVAAFKAYKNKYGDYPPNFSDATALERHLRKAFPRMDATELTALSTEFPTGLQPDEALVFWLSGFSANPQFPLTGPGGPLAGDRMANPLMELKETNLHPSAAGEYPCYKHPGRTQPYIYFNTSRIEVGGVNIPNFDPAGGTDPGVTPIQDDHSPAHFVEPQSFQILSAGLDDDWGLDFPQPNFPAGEPTSVKPQGGWKDNLASFSTKNFEDSVP